MKAGYRLAAGAGALVLTAAIALPALGFGQDDQPRTYVLAQHDEKLDRTVSHHFDHANVNEVLAWLVQQGFSYVVNDRDFGPDTTVTLDFNHVTVREAAHALADALGGHWEREGKVYVFRDGRAEALGEGWGGGSYALAMPPSANFDSEKMRRQMEEMQRNMPHFDSQKLQQQIEKMQRNMPHFDSEKLQRQMEEMKKNMPHFDSEKLERQLEEGDRNRVDAEDMAKRIMQEHAKHKGGQFGWSGNMSPEQEKAFKKSMEEWGRTFSKQFEGQAPRVWVAPDNEAWREYGRKMEEWGRRVEEEARRHKGDEDHMVLPPMPKMPELPEMNWAMPKIAIPPMPPAMHGGGDNGPDVDVEAAPEAQGYFGSEAPRAKKRYIITRHSDGNKPEVEVEGVPEPPEISDSGAPHAQRKERYIIRNRGGEASAEAPRAIDAKRFLASLSREQKQKAWQDGYLRYSELTPEQRQLLGDPRPEGDWRIKLSVDGESIEVRG